MNQKKKLANRLAFGLVGIVLTLIIVAVSLPLFIDVDSYRPQIVQKVNDTILGKLELGKLKLTLWGKVKIQAESVLLKDPEGKVILASKEVFFHFPWLSLLSGAPLVELNLDNPELRILKAKSGKWNFLSLVRSLPSTAGNTSQKETTQSGSSTLPVLATRARLSLKMKNANFNYQDEQSGLSTNIRNLNVVMKDLSLSRPMEMDVWADLNTELQDTKIQGPLKMTAKAQPTVSLGAFKNVKVDFMGNLDALEIVVGNIFHKKKTMAANAMGQIEVSPENAKLNQFKAKFFNAELTGSAELSGLSQMSTDQNSEKSKTNSPKVTLQIQSNEITLAPWAELIPLLKDYQLAGTMHFSANAGGTLENPEYNAEGLIKKLTLKSAQLKAEPQIDAGFKIKTQQVENFFFTLKAPSNDLRFQAKVASFQSPKIDAQIQSTGMDLDALVEFPKVPKQSQSKSETESAKLQDIENKKKEDFDAALDPLRKNAIALQTRAKVQMQMAFVKAYGVKMTDLNGTATFQDLALALDRFQMGLWNAQVKATGGVQMKPKTPTYRFSAEVNGMDIKQAVASQFELFKNTLLGNANFSMQASGASFNPDVAKKTLQAKGSMTVKQASFATIDISRMAKEAIDKVASGLISKIPQLKSEWKKVETSTESKYESITGEFTIANGLFQAPNFYAKAEPNRGFDVRGNTQVNLLNYGLNAQWEVIDTHNILKARDVSVEQSGVRVNRLLVDGEKPLTFPIVVGGTVLEPKPNYLAVPEVLGKIALTNLQRAVESKLKSEAAKKVQEEANKLFKNAPKGAQDALQGLGKKLFGQ